MPGGKSATAVEARRRITTGSVFGDPSSKPKGLDTCSTVATRRTASLTTNIIRHGRRCRAARPQRRSKRAEGSRQVQFLVIRRQSQRALTRAAQLQRYAQRHAQRTSSAMGGDVGRQDRNGAQRRKRSQPKGRDTCSTAAARRTASRTTNIIRHGRRCRAARPQRRSKRAEGSRQVQFLVIRCQRKRALSRAAQLQRDAQRHAQRTSSAMGGDVGRQDRNGAQRRNARLGDWTVTNRHVFAKLKEWTRERRDNLRSAKPKG
jgi:hypothetical protein